MVTGQLEYVDCEFVQKYDVARSEIHEKGSVYWYQRVRPPIKFLTYHLESTGFESHKDSGSLVRCAHIYLPDRLVQRPGFESHKASLGASYFNKCIKFTTRPQVQMRITYG